MRHPVLSFIKAKLSIGDRLAEANYGIVMVAVVTGMVRATATGTPTLESVQVMLVAALGVNISWGLIDGFTNVFANLADMTTEEKLINRLRTTGGDSESRKQTMSALSGTIVRYLEESQRSKIVDSLLDGVPIKPVRNHFSIEDYKVAFAIFLIDFLLIFPVVIPFLIFTNVHLAIFYSQTIATVSFVILGYEWAKYANLSKFKTALQFGLIGVYILLISYVLGW